MRKIQKSGFTLSALPRSATSVAGTLSVAVALAVSAQSAQAQNAGIESIVITAERRETRVGDLSSSVYSVSEESLEKVNAIHISEVMARVPGTWISRGNGQESLTAMRSPVLTGAGSCGAFQMSQDGIPLRAAGYCNVNQLFESNTEQAGGIEVILGPGSVLYGANALHGAINILTQPVSEEFDADLAFDVGPHDYGRIRAGISNTRGDHGFRLNVNGASDGGYKDDSGFDQQKMDLSHRYTGDKYTVTTVLNATNLNQETAGYLQPSDLYPYPEPGYEAYKDHDLKKLNPNPEAYRDASSLHLHSKVDWEVERGMWTVTPYYRKTDMVFLQHFLPGTPQEDNGQESIGLQTMFTHAGSSSMDWTAGVDFELTEGYLKEYQAGPATGLPPAVAASLPQGQHYDFQVDSVLISPFVQYGFKLDDNNRINLGVRYEVLEYDYDNQMLNGRTRDDGTPCAPIACRYARPADRSDDFSNFSAQLGWVHDFDDSQQIFMNVSRAFRAPQTNELYRLQAGQEIADLDSEELLGFEAGYRASRQNMSYGVTAYWMDKENVIFQDSNRNNVSGAETRHRGVDFSSSFLLSQDWTLDMAVSYGRHTYENNPVLLSNVDLDGKTIDTSPKWTGSAQLNWQFAQGQNIELEFVYMDEYYTDDENSPDHIYEGHELVNLRYQADFDSFYLAARITNLLDTDYAERADLGFGNDRYFVGEPASLYVTVGKHF